MNKETYTNGDKTILDTDYYLYLLSCKDKKNKLIKYLENNIKINEMKMYKSINAKYYLSKKLIYQDILKRLEKW